jgi:hypothetical protein
LSPKSERVDRGTVARAGGRASTVQALLNAELPQGKIGPLDAKLADRKGYWATDRLRIRCPERGP